MLYKQIKVRHKIIALIRSRGQTRNNSSQLDQGADPKTEQKKNITSRKPNN
jgi:hypothetical protein